jgi:hypothetical protein
MASAAASRSSFYTDFPSTIQFPDRTGGAAQTVVIVVVAGDLAPVGEPGAMQSSLDARHMSAVTASASPIVLGSDLAGVGITELVENRLELPNRDIRSVSATLLVRLHVAEVPISPL